MIRNRQNKKAKHLKANFKHPSQIANEVQNIVNFPLVQHSKLVNHKIILKHQIGVFFGCKSVGALVNIQVKSSVFIIYLIGGEPGIFGLYNIFP